MRLEKVRQWLTDSGKIWLLRVTFVCGIFITALSAFGIYPLSTNAILVFILGVLFVFAELVFEATSESRQLRHDGALLEWTAATPLIRADARTAKQLSIVGRTGERSYYALRDILEAQRSTIVVRLVLTTTREDDGEFIAYQQGWAKRWRTLFHDTGINGTVDIIRVSAEFQALLLDDGIAYLSFRGAPIGEKATQLPFLRVTAASNEGRFLISLYRTWLGRHDAVACL